MNRPNYNNSILSISNSILRHFGANTSHSTLPELDEILAKEYKNVVLLVMDGMGINVLVRNLPKDAFLRRYVLKEISSVYPCTTTAATVSILCGKSPVEHGWIGWSCYFNEIDKCIDLFTNNESGTGRPASDESLPYKLLGYETILSQIQNATAGRVKTYNVSPFSEYTANTMKGICRYLHKLCNDDGQKFIYAYHFQPDADMHDYGVSDKHIKKSMTAYNSQLEKLAMSLTDTLFIVTADHGMADISMEHIDDYPQIERTLKRHICVEPRCCSFYVKDEHKECFPQLFHSVFKDKFILYTHEEFLESGLLGEGSPHQKVKDFVGDYMAVAVSDIALWYKDEKGRPKNFKGAHAGLCKEELAVPLIVFEKRT